MGMGYRKGGWQMGKKLLIAACGLVLLGTLPGWAGTTGNGWAQPGAAAVPQQAQPRPQNPQTWVLHGKKVSCDTTRGWRHSEYMSHCGHG
jgi:hypothetical protein